MLSGLRWYFTFVLISMLAVTGWASSVESVFVGGGKLLRKPWGIATLVDTYFAFFAFYFWVFYRERSLLPRISWLLGIVFLGNIAMAVYVLLELRKIKPEQNVGDFLFARGEEKV